MENLQNLMQCLDDISKMIPEGTYLEMCDNLKQVHETLPKHGDPPVRDNRRVPFRPVQHLFDTDSESESESDEEDEPWRPEWYDEWTQNEERLRHLNEDIRVLKKTLTTLKPIQRITKKVREAAMKHFVTHSPIFDENVFYQNRSEDGVHTEATFENYVQLSNWSNFSPQERKELTSKKFEKKIYEEYKMFENHRNDVLRHDAMELKRNLEIEMADVRERQDYMRVHYSL
jgi:hypothetical protein